MMDENFEVEPAGYTMSSCGLKYEHPKHGWQHATTTPFRVLAIVSDAETGHKSHLIEVADLDGKKVQVRIPASELMLGGGASIRKLADVGMVILPSMEKIVVAYCLLFRPTSRLELTERNGWHDDTAIFVLPKETVGETDGRKILFLPKAESLTRAIHANGNLVDWISSVARLAKGNPLLVFSLCAALSGPLLKMVGFSGGGAHFYGRSSRGKTTLLQLATSCWGDATDPGVPTEGTMVRTWHTTGNALDALSEAHSDTLLPLDELGTFSGRDLDQVIYQLAGGQEKSTLTTTRKLRNGGKWRSNILSNGEISVRQRIEVSGKRVMAGQLVRMIDIPVSEVFHDTKGMEAGQFANHLKQAVRSQFGTAGPQFVRMLMEAHADDPELPDSFRAHIEEVSETLEAANIEPEQKRILRRLALYQLAGDLAVQWSILPFSEDEVVTAVSYVRDLWYSGGLEISDTVRALDRLRAFILRYHGGFVSIRNKNAFHTNARAYYNPEQGIYLFDDDQLQQACGGVDPLDVAKELRGLGLLVTHEGGRLKVKQKLAWLDGRWVRFYGIHSKIVGEKDNGEENASDENEMNHDFDFPDNYDS